MKKLKRKYQLKVRYRVKSNHWDKYYELLCDIFFKKYNLTRDDIRNCNGGEGFIISKAKSIICFILRSERKYSLSVTARIMSSRHDLVWHYLKMHHKRISRNEFGYQEMFSQVLSYFLFEVSRFEKQLTCNPCVALGFERFKGKRGKDV